ncbi:xanthine dehydrogenase-like [Anopheles stephensi]|uniref:xanthine dehydrogenase-like n=1 Tax=Anopheles stephensi TaxID=30069 RepID=UPI001658B320|nr:xanthine dehydrogenase-like [Anopheles stephensi]
MSVTFTVNGTEFIVQGTEINVNTSLTFIRNHAHLTGTKFMCLEGGCGACVVNLSGVHPVSGEPFSYAVNSCLFPVLACHGMDITTVEGIGGKQRGYHATQKLLAHFNGTQCGYCSPGMVMNMYSLLETKKGKVTMEEIENSFGGNICRCTGYRPILDAFKALAVDADPKIKEKCQDIEDLTKICPKTGSACGGKCSAAGKINPNKGLHLSFDEQKEWHKVYNVSDIFAIFESIGDKPYTLIGGNTAHGVYRRNDAIKVFIDINAVQELRASSVGSSLTVGAGTSLTELMDLLAFAAKQNKSFSYFEHLIRHIDLIANVPVRNTGTIAGNLSIKNQHPEFPSDLYLILEAADAKLTILESKGKTSTVRPSEYVTLDMRNKLLLNVILPPLDPSIYVYRSFKIMPRAQNAHAYVNGAFLIKLDGLNIVSSNICFGGIDPHFTHAIKTEEFLKGKNLHTNETIQGALKILAAELNPDWVLPDAAPEYRKNLALSLFYKFTLNVASVMNATVKTEYKSGGYLLHRHVSSGVQQYDGDQRRGQWSLDKKVPKIEGLHQTSGEAKFINDLPTFPGELYAAFVLGTTVHAEIDSFDTEEALRIPGVVAFYTAKDIPGNNDFMPVKSQFSPNVEEVFCSGRILFHGQPVGLMVANTFEAAQKAAQKVRLNYSAKADKPIYPTVKDVADAKCHDRVVDIDYGFTGKSYTDSVTEPSITVSGTFESGGQYHYTMETQTCVCLPLEDGMEVHSATQAVTLTQIAIAQMLGVPENSLNVSVRRIGGGYGGKASRAVQIACACALACHLTKRPVRLIMTIESNMAVVGKRYGVVSSYCADVTAEGQILRLRNEFLHDAGCNTNEAPDFMQGYYGNCYNKDAWCVISKTALTDSASNTWCRAPGSTEAYAMIESIIEHIAFATERDSLAVRLENMPTDSPMRPLLQTFLVDTEYERRRLAIEQFNLEHRWRKRGIAIVPMKYPVSYFGTLHALVSIYHTDGTVAIAHGGIEMGQGINTRAAQVAAKVLGIPVEKIAIKATNNLTAPNDFCTQASITSEAVAHSVLIACELLLSRIKPVRQQHPDVPWEKLTQLCHLQGVDLCATAMYDGVQLPSYNVWALSCAEIELDVLTGNVVLHRVDILEDAGQTLNPEIEIGQIEGAFMMGVGLYLTEALIYDRGTGELLTNRSWNYRVPGPKDIPVEFKIRLLPSTINPTGVQRSKATGEPAVNMAVVVLFALRNAINAARLDAGAPRQWIPLGSPSTPDRILGLLGNSTDQYLLH